jgi:YhcG PDDEXK nuclease domain
MVSQGPRGPDRDRPSRAPGQRADQLRALLNDVQSFLVEMGRGFALVGRQFPLRIHDADSGEEQEFFIDLLERQPQDEPSIGLVLCPGRNRTVTEWALRGVDAPVAVARYTTAEMTLTDTPPSELKRALPELPELASALSGIVQAADVIYDEGSSAEEAGEA